MERSLRFANIYMNTFFMFLYNNFKKLSNYVHEKFNKGSEPGPLLLPAGTNNLLENTRTLDFYTPPIKIKHSA